MLYLIILTGLLFIGMAFILTVNNAKYILSGYNTMSNEEKARFDIHSYVPFFKNFHIKLGTSVIFLGGVMLYFLNEQITALFLACYPIAAYIYFIWAGLKYSGETNQLVSKICITVLILTLVFVVMLFLKYGF